MMTISRTNPLSTDRLNDLEQVPGRLIYEGGRVEVSRGNEWIPGTIVGLAVDDERGGVIDIDLDRPDSTGAIQVWCDAFGIRAISGAGNALQQIAAE